MMPELSSALVHSTFPVLGSKAMKCPSVLPLNIRPPAVVSVAPAQGIWVSYCQTCLPVFRSTACTDPQLGVVGSCLTSKDSSRNASPALYATGSAPLMSMQACCVGMYAIWVCGSTEIGHQFFPPSKLGHDRLIGAVVVPGVIRRPLVVPLDLAGIRIERQHRVGVQVVARTQGRQPWAGIADAPDQRVGRGMT